MRQLGLERAVGFVGLILGISLLLLSFVNFTRTYTVVDTAFSLEPGETYEPRYHPPTDGVLKGKVSVEGEGIYVSVQGLAYEIENVLVDSNFNFTIDPSFGWDHVYVFSFDNTEGDAESHVEFVLDETLTESPIWPILRSVGLPRSLWLVGIAIGIVLLPLGFILILRSLLQERRKRIVLIEHLLVKQDEVGISLSLAV